MNEFSRSLEKDAYVLIGPPGSGKSSVTKKLTERFQAKLVSGRDIVPTLVGKYEGVRGLIPDEHFLPALRDRLSEILDGQDSPIVFDNIPRTKIQAEEIVRWSLERNVNVKTVSLLLTQDEVLDRVINRTVCPECKTSYHPNANPARIASLCNLDGATLVRRSGDKEENIPHAFARHIWMTREITPILGQCGPIFEIDASSDISSTISRVLKVIVA